MAGIRCCYGGRSHSAWCGEGCCGSGRVGRVSRGVAPPLTPRARHRVVAFCCCVFSFCFLSGGYALPLGVAPVFFDSLCARYARRRILCAKWGGGRERASRFGAWDCLTRAGAIGVCALRSSVRRLRCCALYGVVGCGWHARVRGLVPLWGHLNE